MLTKDQIDTKTFKKGLFGYNKDEVHSFLRSVADDYADLQTKYAALQSENEVSKKSLMENSVKIYELEKQLEQAAPGSKKEANAANAEANKIINDAKKKANEVIANAKAELAKLKEEMEALKSGSSAKVAEAADKVDVVEADPVTKLKMKTQGDAPQKLKMTSKPAQSAEPKPAAFTGKSAQVAQEEEEELIIGEVEEGVKRNQVLIGDGDEDADFEFL
ncbi:MAG: DivIVA domain-containing protein [Coprococcus sp.]|nr:DivIVA domain-containing protein [Coprococcus sp.]